MGLIKAALGSFNGTMADQWKEFFSCDALDKNVLVAKGHKQVGKRSSNTKGSDNVITNGSGIAVADGQAMIIVEQGKIVEFCAEPGQFTWDSSTEPSIFVGNLGDSIKQTFATMARRFTMGGSTGKDQRVYYFNTKEIIDNKFGTPNPFMFRVVNKNLNMDRTVSVRCNGVYSYKIADPILFYKEVCGNVTATYERSEIDNQLKTEFISGLQPAFAKLSDLELRPSQIPAHQTELEAAMNEVLKNKWLETRGIKVCSIALNPITLAEEDLKKIQQMEDAAAYAMNPAMMGARMGEAGAAAMEAAANNANGAMAGFMGMGMAANAMNGMGIQGMFQQGAAQQQAAPAQTPPANGWTCSCGSINTGKFCENCGAAKPAAGWTCKCGAVNQGKFCAECGAPKPAGAPLYRCDKCGWTPADPHNPPKFCSECGDPFDDKDIQ